MPDEDKTFNGSLVLDLRIWWRRMHTVTLFTDGVPEVNKSRNREMPKNFPLAFHMGEVDTAITKERFFFHSKCRHVCLLLLYWLHTHGLQNNRIDDKSTHWDLHCAPTVQTCSASCLNIRFLQRRSKKHEWLGRRLMCSAHNSFILMFKVSSKLGKLLATAYNLALLTIRRSCDLRSRLDWWVLYSFEHTEQSPGILDIQSIIIRQKQSVITFNWKIIQIQEFGKLNEYINFVEGHSSHLHCASLLRIIYGVMFAHARARAHWKHGRFALILSSFCWKMAIAH